MKLVLPILGTLLALMLSPATRAAGDVKQFVPSALVNPNAFYPEGPQLIAKGLLVAEMPKNRVVLIDGGQIKTVWHAEGCGPTSIKKIPAGGYWVLCHLGHFVARLDRNFATIRIIEQTTSARRIAWPNDASVDSAGNLYLSSSGQFSLSAPAEGRVVFIDERSNIASDLAGGLRYSNGVLVQEGKRRVLVSEHLRRRILAFPLMERGKLGSPVVFFDFNDAPAIPDAYEQSGPDGMAAFTDGDICVADYGNGRIIVLSESGRFLEQFPVQYRFVTNMAIAKSQKSIFVMMTESNASPDLHGVVQEFKIKAARRQ